MSLLLLLLLLLLVYSRKHCRVMIVTMGMNGTKRQTVYCSGWKDSYYYYYYDSYNICALCFLMHFRVDCYTMNM